MKKTHSMYHAFLVFTIKLSDFWLGFIVNHAFIDRHRFTARHGG